MSTAAIATWSLRLVTDSAAFSHDRETRNA